MVSVFNEKALFKRVESGNSFKLSNYTLVVLQNGSFSIEENGKLVHYVKGNVAGGTPYNLYKVHSYSDDLKVFFIVIDRVELLNKITFLFNKYEIIKALNSHSNTIKSLSDTAFTHLLELCNQLFFYSRRGNDVVFSRNIQFAILTSMIYIIVGDFLRDTNNKINIFENTRKEDIVMKFIQLVNKNFVAEKELAFYADKLKISVKYLSNTVREVTTQPPTKFIAEAIINKSKIMLLNSEHNIKEIAHALGFSDQYAFGKFFKKNTGFSPTDFKKSNKIVNTVLS